MAAFLDRLDNIARHSSTLNERLPHSVFLKPIGDEAALALNWTSAMAALMQGGSSVLFVSLQSLRDRWMALPRRVRIIGGLCLTAAWSLGTMLMVLVVLSADSLGSGLAELPELALEFGEWPESIMSVVLIWALLAWGTALLMLLGCVVVLLVALLAAAGAGMPSLTAALYFRVAVEPVPVGSHRLVLVDVSSPQTEGFARDALGRLSHSALYNSSDSIRAVIEALASFDEARAMARRAEARPAGGGGA